MSRRSLERGKGWFESSATTCDTVREKGRKTVQQSVKQVKSYH